MVNSKISDQVDLICRLTLAFAVCIFFNTKHVRWKALLAQLDVHPTGDTTEEASWSGSALFAIQYVNLYQNLDQGIWFAEN